MRGAWIEGKTTDWGTAAKALSHLVRGAWIEGSLLLVRSCKSLVAPRERCVDRRSTRTRSTTADKKSHLVRGAWIEGYSCAAQTLMRTVAPRERCVDRRDMLMPVVC